MILTEFIDFTLVRYDFISFWIFNLKLHIKYMLTCKITSS
jgi:hypothetical protein